MSASDVARLLELGTKLERATLTVSVEDLQRDGGLPVDDPWQGITDELMASIPPLA